MSGDYVVYVDDNFHFTDEEDRYEAGRFATLTEAIECCRQQVRDDLLHLASHSDSEQDLIRLLGCIIY